MKQDVVTTKIKRESLRKLKAIAALKQETMLSMLERLIDAELEQASSKKRSAHEGDTGLQNRIRPQ